jgi:hypothetical protein
MNQRDEVDLKKDSIAGVIYPTQSYSKAGNLLNPHSWAPIAIDAGNIEVKPGVMVLSQNTLSSMFVNAGFEYDLNEQTGKFYTGISYEGLFPVFDLTFDIGTRAALASYHSWSAVRFTWQETNLKFIASIPFNFSHGRYIRRLEPSLGTTLIGIKHLSSTPEQFTSGLIQTLDYRLYAYQYQRSNQKDVYPRFGQFLNLNYRHSPFTENNMGSIFAGTASLYFPGIIRHQGVLLYLGYQEKHEVDDLSYAYSNNIKTPRGWTSISDPQMVSMQLNYKFPVIYPDFSAGSIVYLKRVKANLFYDMTIGWENNSRYDYKSTGIELTADFHVLRFLAPIEMGVRAVYFPSYGDLDWEFLYSIGLP